MKVRIKPRTEDTKSLVDSMGEIWDVKEDVRNPLYGSRRKLHLERVVDKGQFRSTERMWVGYPYDELFEVFKED